MSTETRWIERLRNPEYTGENRCIPCTLLNIAIALVVAVGVATTVPALGIALFAVSIAVIYLRGYLVPYTPTITKRYFPDRVLRWFDKHPTESGNVMADLDEVEDLDVEQTLYSLGVITECEQVDDLCLDETFEAAWHDEIDDVREKGVTPEHIRDLLRLEEGGDHEIEQRGSQAAIVFIDGNVIGQWESDASLAADLAADRALREWTDEWDRFHVINRSELLNSLRMFLEVCPECGDPVSLGQETVDSCCRSFDVIAVSCDGCGSRLFEIELTERIQQEL